MLRIFGVEALPCTAMLIYSQARTLSDRIFSEVNTVTYFLSSCHLALHICIFRFKTFSFVALFKRGHFYYVNYFSRDQHNIPSFLIIWHAYDDLT